MPVITTVLILLTIVLVAWVGITMLLTFWLIKRSIGLRASREEELQGLDVPEHGIEAFPVEIPVIE